MTHNLKMNNKMKYYKVNLCNKVPHLYQMNNNKINLNQFLLIMNKIVLNQNN